QRGAPSSCPSFPVPGEGWVREEWSKPRGPALRFDRTPSYNTPPCEAPMPFTIHPCRRVPVQCAVRYHAGPFLTLPLAYVLGFGALITCLVLNTEPAYAEWVEIDGSEHAGLTVAQQNLTQVLDLKPAAVNPVPR